MIIQHQSGMAAEYYIASYYTQKGYEVLWPFSGQSRYDFVAEKDGQFIKVQCKKATWSKNQWHNYLQSRISSRNKCSKPLYSEGDFDEYAFTDDAGRIWIFPFKVLEGLTSVCLDGSSENYRSYKKEYDPKDYLVKSS